MKHLFTAAAFALSIPLASCAGFQPMHGTQSTQTAFTDMSVTVGDGKDEADRQAGYLIRQRLADRISASDTPTYELIIEPSAKRVGLGLTGEDFATRFDRLVSAKWTLLKREDGSVIAKGRTQSTATYSADRDPYRLQSTSNEATDRAARELADKLLTDVALELAELPAL
ncbi:MAG: LPS assembly lipoprotein LptE [Litorimonas sp.]